MNVRLTERERQIIMSSLFAKAITIKQSITVLKEMKDDELSGEIAEYQKDIVAIVSIRKKLSKENILTYAIDDIILEGYDVILGDDVIIIQDNDITISLRDNGNIEVKSDSPFSDRLFNNLYALVSYEWNIVAKILEKRKS